MSHVDAAALALTGLTALCSIEDSLKLKSGETILIQGGAGGVASFAIQLAKHLGARVITTASAANLSYLRDIGADEVIDYNATDFTKAVRNCDAVFDTVGGDVATRSFAVLKPGGRAAFIASGPKAPTPDRTDVIALAALCRPRPRRISSASPRSIRRASSASRRSSSTICRRPPKRIGSARAGTCEASWCSRCVDRGGLAPHLAHQDEFPRARHRADRHLDQRRTIAPRKAAPERGAQFLRRAHALRRRSEALGEFRRNRGWPDRWRSAGCRSSPPGCAARFRTSRRRTRRR